MKRILMSAMALCLVCQAGALALDEQAESMRARYRNMAATLQNKIMSVDFKEAPFDDVVSFFRASTGLNVVVDPAIFESVPREDFTVTMNVSDLPAGDILDLILRFKNISRAFRYGVLYITTVEKAAGKPFMRMYDVRDLNVPLKDFPGVDIELKSDSAGAMTPVFIEEEEQVKHYATDEIVDLLRESCGEGTWDTDGCRITIFKGVLIVVQTEGVHVEISKLLAQLRATR